MYLLTVILFYKSWEFISCPSVGCQTHMEPGPSSEVARSLVMPGPFKHNFLPLITSFGLIIVFKCFSPCFYFLRFVKIGIHCNTGSFIKCVNHFCSAIGQQFWLTCRKTNVAVETCPLIVKAHLGTGKQLMTCPISRRLASKSEHMLKSWHNTKLYYIGLEVCNFSVMKDLVGGISSKPYKR